MESNTNSDHDDEDDDYYPRPNYTITNSSSSVTNNNYVHELFKHLDTDHNDAIFNNTITLIFFNISELSKNNKFIQFMLEKKNDVLSFPKIKINQNIKPEIAQLLNVDVSILKYKGYTTFQGNIHLFIQTDKIFTPLFVQRDQRYWFCIVDEIVNYKKVCNFRIDSACRDFILSNPDFYTLKNPDTYRGYELPIIVYSGNIFNQVELDGNFGVSKKNEYSFFGPHFYFTTYEKAVEMGGWSDNKTKCIRNGCLLTDNEYGRYIKGGINRFALFCGKHHIIYKPQLKYNVSETFDSIYVGEMQLNSHIYNDSPMWIVKSSANFKSLSYHLLDKTTLGEYWNRDYTQYFIS
jgi:hypothetical protein